MEKYFNVIEWAYNISVAVTIIPLMATIFKWKFFNFPLKIVGIYCLRSLIQSSMGLYLYYTDQSNRLLFYVSPSLDIILISLLTVSIFDFKNYLKLSLTLLCAIFIGLIVNDYLTTTTLISSYLSTAETVFVILVSVLMLRKIALQYKSSTYKRSLIWIISALLISNLFSILITTLNQKIMGYSNDLLHFLWYLSSPFFIVITNLMVAYGFYIIRNKVREA